MVPVSYTHLHIVNYAKTRETYVAYRKAGYSKKFRQEHEEEILLHQAAKLSLIHISLAQLFGTVLAGQDGDIGCLLYTSQLPHGGAGLPVLTVSLFLVRQ